MYEAPDFYSSTESYCADCGTTWTFPEYTQCTVDTSDNFVAWTACYDSYVDPNTGLCTTQCGIGRYGQTTYNQIGMVATSTCMSCDSSCYECAGPGTNQCLSCPNGYYLSIGQLSTLPGQTPRSTGTCVAKTTTPITATIYVNSISTQNSATPESIDGTYNNAFNTLMDALDYAYSIGAPSTDATITILMKTGTHGMVYRSDWTQILHPANKDQYSQTTSIIIDSEDSTTQVTVYYKLRDQFHFKVGAGLSISNIIFNATDSTINYQADYQAGTGCLLDPTKECCSVTLDSYYNFFPVLDSSNSLCTNVQFNNFYYEFNSFIEFNDFGGYVVVTNSVFKNINTCGSIFRNKQVLISNDTYDDTDWNSLFQWRQNTLQYELQLNEIQLLAAIDPYNGVCSETPETDGLPTCFSIVLDSVQFLNFGSQKENGQQPDDALFVNPQYQMQFTGQVIDLDGFGGDLTVVNSNFYQVNIFYYTCDAADEMAQYLTYMIDEYPNLGAKTALQIKSAISLVNYKFNINIVGNTFSYSTGTKGLIYIDALERKYYHALIANNTFNMNAGYFASNLIFIRARGPSTGSVYTIIPSAGNEFCGGYSFFNNQITQTTGCSINSGSVIHMECVDYSQTYATYNSFQYGSNDVDNYFFPTLSSSVANSYYNINQSAHTVVNSNFVYGSYSYSVDLNLLTFSGNEFNTNYGTGGVGLVQLNGFPRIYMYDEIYTGNGEASWDLLYYWFYPLLFVPYNDCYDFFGELYTYQLSSCFDYDSSYFLKSVIGVSKTSQLTMRSMTFDKNYLVEVEYFDDSAQLLLLSEMYGEFELSTVTITNQYGPYKNQFCTWYYNAGCYVGFQFLDAYGSKNPLFRHQSTDKIKYVNFLSGSNMFQNVTYIEDYYNSDSRMFFQFSGTNGGTYELQSAFSLSNSQFINVTCFQCYSNPFLISASSFTFSNVTFSKVNRYVIDSGMDYPQQSAFFYFYIHQPYKKGSIIITEVLTVSSVTVNQAYFGEGMLFQIAYQTWSNLQTPTTPQIVFQNSAFTTMTTLSSGAVGYFDVGGKILMSMSSCNFTSISATTDSNYPTSSNWGGAFYLTNIASVVISSVIVSGASATATTSDWDGGGSFINVYQTKALTFSISSSQINCSTTEYTYNNINSNYFSPYTFNQGPGIYIYTGNKALTFTSTNTGYANCYGSYGGGALRLLPTVASTVTLTGNSFYGNSGLSGGTIYAQYSTMVIKNNSFVYGYGYYGGEIYIYNPSNNMLELDSNNFTYSSAYYSGGVSYIDYSTNNALTIYVHSSSQYQSQFNSIYGWYGGIFEASVYKDINLTIYNTFINSISTGVTGGILDSDTMQGNLNILIKNSFINNSQAGTSGDGGGSIFSSLNVTKLAVNIQILNSQISNLPYQITAAFYFLQHTTSNIIITNSTFNTISGTSEGSLFYLLSTSSTFTISSSTFSNMQLTGDGGLAYISATSAFSSTISGTTFYNVQSSSNGGLFSVTSSTSTFTMSTSTLSYLVASYGSLLYTNDHTTTITMTSNTISNSYAVNSGGLFYLNSLTSVGMTISNTSINTVNAYNGQGGVVYSYSPSFSFTLNSGSNLQNVNALQEGGMIFANGSSSTSVTISSSSVSSTSSSSDGGLAYLQTSGPVTLSITSSNFSSLVSQGSGGGFAIEATTLTMSMVSSRANGIQASISGGFLSLQSTSASITLQNSIISSSQAQIDGGFLDLALSAGLTANILNTSISSTQAGGYGGFLSMSGTQMSLSLGSGTSTSNTYATYGGFVATTLSNSASNNTLSLSSSTVSGSYSSYNGGFAQIIGDITLNMQTTISNSVISSTQSSQGNGGFLSVQSLNSIVTLSNTTVSSAYAGLYGGLLDLEVTNQSITTFNLGSTISNIQAGWKGGVISSGGTYQSIDFDTISINNCSAYSSTYSTQNTGGVIYSYTTDNLAVTLNKVTAQNFYGSPTGSFLMMDTASNTQSNLIISQSTFTGSSQTWSSVQTSIQTYLQASTITYGTMFYIPNSNTCTVTLTGNTFQNAYTTGQGVVFYLQNALFQDTSSTYQYLGGQTGAIHCVNCTVTADSSTFSSAISNYGSFFNLIGSSLILTNVSMDYATALQNGGAIMLSGTSLPSTMSLNSCPPMYSNMTATNGAFIYANTNSLSINLSGCNWKNLRATNQGGLISSPQLNSLDIFNCTFVNVYSDIDGSLISSSSNGFTLTAQNSSFRCLGNSTYPGNFVTALNSSSSTIIGSLFSISNSPSITAAYNTYQDCRVANQGGVYNLYNSTLVDQNSQYINNAAYKGGAIYMEEADVSLTNITFTNHYAQYGGIFQITDTSTLSLTSVTVTTAYSTVLGAFINQMDYLTSSTVNIALSKVTLSYLTSAQWASGISLNGQGVTLDLNNLTASNLQAQNGGLIYALSALLITLSQVSVSDTYVSNTQSGSVIYSTASANVQLTQVNVICNTTLNTTFAQYDKNTVGQSSAFYFSSSSLITGVNNKISNCAYGGIGGAFTLIGTTYTETNSVFYNNAGRSGGAIFCTQCSFNLKNIEFDNQFAYQGGIVYAQDVFNGVFDNVTIDTVYSINSGGAIYALQTTPTATLSVLQFQNGLQGSTLKTGGSGGLIYANNPNLDINLNTVVSISDAYATQYGGVIYASALQNLLIQDGTYQNLTAGIDGSFLYSNSTNLNLAMSDNVFMGTTNNAAYKTSSPSVSNKGGAFYIANSTLPVQSTNNSISNFFIGNKGGAFGIFNAILIDTDSTYTQNQAVSGGALYCQSCTLSLTNLDFDQHMGSQGGLIYLSSVNTVTMTSINISSSTALTNGGVVYQSGTTSSTITLSQFLIDQATALAGSGGIWYASNKLSSLIISHGSMSNFNSSGAPGGGFYLKNLQSLTLSNINAFTFSSTDTGAFLYSQATTVSITVQDSSITCNTQPVQIAQLASYIFSGTPSSNYNGAFYIVNAVLVTSIHNYFAYCYMCAQGSVFSLYGTTFTDTNSVYYSNAAILGGAILSNSSTVSMQSITFEENYAYRGGVFYFNNSNPATLTDIDFLTSYAWVSGGAVYVYTYQNPDVKIHNTVNPYTMIFQNCTFNDSRAYTQYGGVFYIDSQDLVALNMTDSSVDQAQANYSGGVFYITSFNGTLNIVRSSPTAKKQTFSNFNAQLNGGFLYYQSQYSVSSFGLNLDNNEFNCTDESNYQSYDDLTNLGLSNAGAFYIYQGIYNMTSTNNQFQFCGATTDGGVFYLTSTQLTESNSVYYQTSASSGGVFACSSCQIIADNVTITDTSANSGGVFHLDNTSPIQVTNSIIQDISADTNGGFLNIIKSSLTTIKKSSIYITNCQKPIQNISSGSEGGLIYVSNQYANIYISSCSMKDLSSESAGLMYIQDAGNVSISNSKFNNILGSSTALINSQSLYLNLTLSRNNFVCQPSVSISTIQTYLQNAGNQSQYNQQYNIFVQQAISVQSYNNTFSQCGVTNNGGVFALLSTNFSDFNSNYKTNSGNKGGVIFSQNSNLTIQQSIFQNNYAYQAGVISLDQFSYLNCTACSFVSNQAYYTAGVISVTTSSYFDATNCVFDSNTAVQNSVLEVLGASAQFYINIVNCKFTSNVATMNTFQLMYSLVSIHNTTFQYNSATSRSKNIFAEFSTIIITDSVFKSQSASNNALYLQQDQTLGSFIYMILDVYMYINNTQFQNGLSREGGAIYVLGESSLNLYKCQFTNNQAYVTGGAIYASGFSSISIDSTTFTTNLASTQLGDDIYAINTANPVTITNSTFYNPNAKTSIYADTVSLSLKSVQMMEMYGTGSTNGAGIQCIDCASLQISYSSFKDMKSVTGGCLYISESAGNKNKNDPTNKYQIDHSTFTSCYSEVGGAIATFNQHYLVIENSTFQSNQASYDDSASQSGWGGAIYYTCTTNYNCSMSVALNSRFINNQADIQGGGIYWDTLQPYVDNNTYFYQNYAQQYGNDIACYAQILAVITQEAYDDVRNQLGLSLSSSNSSRRLESRDLQSYSTSEIVESQRSGGTLPTTYLAHVDMYGQIVASDFASKVRIAVNALSDTNPLANTFSPSIQGSTDFQAEGGMVEVSGVTFSGTPGYSYQVVFSTNGIDMSKLSNQEYAAANNLGGAINFDLNISLRDCAVGEYYSNAGQCIECPAGTSYSLVAMTQPGSCETCPSSQALCMGGSNVGPQAGYWRKNNVTSNFLKCLYQPACLGMIPPDYNPMGDCDTGYNGILCANCWNDYSRTGDFECSLCPDKITNALRIIGVGIITIGVLVYLVRSTLHGAQDVNNVTSIYLKIVLNHVQLILLTASFKFNWPQQVQSFFNTAKPVASTSTQILSVDCFLTITSGLNYTSNNQTNSNPDTQGTIRVFYFKLILYALLPILLGVVSFGFWHTYRFVVICRAEQKKKQISRKEFDSFTYNNKAISTLVILLFLFHPSIVTYMFDDFNCIDVDGDDRLQDDLQIICYSSTHSFFSYAVALPSIIVWGLGIPAFAFILLARQRKSLEKIEVREQLGFLYRGYSQKFYFWEIVIMYRKIALIFISVFLVGSGVITQALIVFMIVVVFLAFNIKRKPFMKEALNDLETLSLITSLISVYCGIFFIAQNPEVWIQENPNYSTGSVYLNSNTQLAMFFLIVIANLIFLAYWAYKMYQEVKVKFRNSLPKLYLCLCLCFKNERLQRELEQFKIDEENELLREKYFKCMKDLKLLYTTGKIKLNHNKLEKLLQYLDPRKIEQLAHDVKTESDLIKERKAKSRNERTKKGKYNQDVVFEAKIYPYSPNMISPGYRDTDDEIEDFGDGIKQHRRNNSKQGLITIEQMDEENSLVDKAPQGNAKTQSNYLNYMKFKQNSHQTTDRANLKGRYGSGFDVTAYRTQDSLDNNKATKRQKSFGQGQSSDTTNQPDEMLKKNLISATRSQEDDMINEIMDIKDKESLMNISLKSLEEQDNINDVMKKLMEHERICKEPDDIQIKKKKTDKKKMARQQKKLIEEARKSKIDLFQQRNLMKMKTMKKRNAIKVHDTINLSILETDELDREQSSRSSQMIVEDIEEEESPRGATNRNLLSHREMEAPVVKLQTTKEAMVKKQSQGPEEKKHEKVHNDSFDSYYSSEQSEKVEQQITKQISKKKTIQQQNQVIELNSMASDSLFQSKEDSDQDMAEDDMFHHLSIEQMQHLVGQPLYQKDSHREQKPTGKQGSEINKQEEQKQKHSGDRQALNKNTFSSLQARDLNF